MADERPIGPDGRPLDRRAPERALYSADQLLGRRPIRLRRRSDKVRLGAHAAAVAGLLALSAWWVVPLHAFAGPVVLTLTRTHGVHAGDLPTLLFLALAGRSTWIAARLAQGS